MLTTAGLLILIWLPFQIILQRTRLELSFEGVCLWQTGYKLEAPWTDVARVRLDRGCEGFITSVPMTGKGADRLARFRGVSMRYATVQAYDDEQRALLAERRLIPIEAFAWYLRRGMMRADIEKFAPHCSHGPVGRASSDVIE